MLFDFIKPHIDIIYPGIWQSNRN